MRTPSVESARSNGHDKIVFERYDDGDFGYLRVVVDTTQLSIEYHPASDGEEAKTPDEVTTVDIAIRKLARFKGN